MPSLVGSEMCIRDSLYKIGLIANAGFNTETYELPVNIFGTRGRRTFIPVSVDGKYAWPVARDSYMIASYAWADGYIEISADAYAPLSSVEKVKVVLHKNPIRTLYSMTDIGGLDKYSNIIENNIGSGPFRIIHVPRDQVDEKTIMNLDHMITSDLLLNADEIDGKESTLLFSRELVKLKRNDRCEYTGIRSGYSFLAKHAEGAILYHPRFQGLIILFRRGYLDCAIVPSDLLEIKDNKDLIDYSTDIVAKENVMLLSKSKTGF
jgi:hypothetical protein